MLRLRTTEEVTQLERQIEDDLRRLFLSGRFQLPYPQWVQALGKVLGISPASPVKLGIALGKYIGGHPHLRTGAPAVGREDAARKLAPKITRILQDNGELTIDQPPSSSQAVGEVDRFKMLELD